MLDSFRLNFTLRFSTIINMLKYQGPRKNAINVMGPGLLVGGTLGATVWAAVVGIGGLFLSGAFIAALSSIPIIGTGAAAGGLITVGVIASFAIKYYREQFRKFFKKSERQIANSTNSIMSALSINPALMSEVKQTFASKDYTDNSSIASTQTSATYKQIFNAITSATYQHIFQGYLKKTAGGFNHDDARFQALLRLNNIEILLEKIISTTDEENENRTLKESLLILVGYISIIKEEAEEKHKQHKGWFHFLTKSNLAISCDRALKDVFERYKETIDANVDKDAVITQAKQSYIDFSQNRNIETLFQLADTSREQSIRKARV